MRVLKGLYSGVERGEGKAASHAAPPTTYAGQGSQACYKADLAEVTALHGTTKTPHVVETSGLWQIKKDGWIKGMLINIKLLA